MLYGDVGGHMCSFAQLTDYSREAFRIDREILFIFNTGVHTSRPAGTQLSPRHSSHVPRVSQAHSISDETQLESFRLSINAPDAAVTLRLLQSTEPIPSRRTLTVPALDFSGSGTLNQSGFVSQLKKAIYPGTGQHRAGALCEEAVRLLAANPDRLLAFDQLRELVRLVTGNELLLLTPVLFLCPLHGRGCHDGQVMLFNDNTLRGLEQHLRLAHRGEERAGHLLARLVYAREHPYCSAAELTERAGPFELQPSDRRPDDRSDLLLRPPPRRLHWVARWLNVLMTEPHPDGGVPQLSLQHVFVQMIIFFLYLAFPHAAAAAVWQTVLPHLFHYAGALFYISKEMGYRLARGRVLFAKGRPWEVIYRIAEWQRQGEEGVIVAHVADHQAWMVRFGEVGTLLRCERAPRLRLAVHRRVVAPEEGERLRLELRVIEGSIDLLGQAPLKLRREREVDCGDVNIPLPEPQSLRAAELPGRHSSGPNFETIVAFLEVAPTLTPPPPMLEGNGCKVVLVSQKFDKRPLNQCGYAHAVRGEDGVLSGQLLGLYEKAADGTLNAFTATRIEELIEAGPSAYRRALQQATYVSDVEETSTNTLDLALTLNTHTGSPVTVTAAGARVRDSARYCAILRDIARY